MRSPELAKEFPLILVTGARIPEYTHWQMRNVPKLREQAPEPVAELHPNTAKKHGIGDGDMVILETRRGQVRIKAKTTEDMMSSVVSMPHGWGDVANENVSTALDARDPVTGYPELRALACRIRKV
jgi:anaerobic selenocysteine-containing dehydrogenase